MARGRAVVALPADTFESAGLLFHSLGDKYVRAVAEVARCVPLMVPAIADLLDIDAVLEHVDGVMMTGALSNVHPPRYGEQAADTHKPFDERRDDLTLELIRRCLARGRPLLCVCRGFQELNVALGGTLEGELQAAPGRIDHRAPKASELDVLYGPAHDIEIVAGGVLEDILGSRRIKVNSLHRQGLARVADGLSIEATAADGVVEAVSVREARNFALGVQWHPEYKAASNPHSVKLFEAFGRAVRS